jgi:AAA ATPase, central domain protein
MAKAKRSELPEEYKEIWDELIMPVNTNIDFNKVILSDENKKKYQEVIKEQKYRDKLFEYGLEPQNRIILFGASGTGKTYSTKALSNLLDYTMIYVDIAKALSEGNVSINLRNLFKLGNYIAEKYNGAILFLDECDSVAWNRDQTATGDSGVIRRATNSIFQGMDQMSKNIIFVAATNMLHRLDNAFERRFNVKMRFTRPQTDLDESIKHFMFPKFILNDDVDDTVRDIIKKKVLQNNKMSYYEIEEVVKKAMKRSVLNDTAIVNTSDIYNDLAINMNVNFKFLESRKQVESIGKSKQIL